MNVLLIKETALSDVLTLLEVTLAIALLVIAWRLMPKPAAVRSNQTHYVSIIVLKIDVNLCTSTNGGCSHTCTSINGSQVICSCMLGYQLDSDGSTCTGKRTEDIMYLVEIGYFLKTSMSA